MSGRASRAKGKAGEVESARLFTAAGWDVRPLQSGQKERDDAGDYLVQRQGRLDKASGHWDKARRRYEFRFAPTLIVQARRREKTRVIEASRQVEAAARDGEIPVVVYRPSREPWRVSLRLDDLLKLLG